MSCGDELVEKSFCCAVGSSLETDFPRRIDSGSSVCVSGCESPCERVKIRFESMIECRKEGVFRCVGVIQELRC